MLNPSGACPTKWSNKQFVGNFVGLALKELSKGERDFANQASSSTTM